jgi:Capsule assembly protein Wzi
LPAAVHDLSKEACLKPFFCTLAAAIVSLSMPAAFAVTPASADDANVAPSAYESPLAGSTYVPIDSWMYPALDRLHALGYIDTAFLGLRPWTRLSIAHMLEESADKINQNGARDPEAQDLYVALWKEVSPDVANFTSIAHPSGELASIYTQFRGIGGIPLRDSYHLGQTLVDDYGRPYESGFNNYTGFSARSEAGRFSLYFRGEYQHAPSATGYSQALSAYLSNAIDAIPYDPNVRYDTIPTGPIAAVNPFRVMEANLSYHALGHEISFGKNDHWLSPDQGASFAWSNNAEDIYDFEINRIDPLRIPLLSRLIGPVRYDFFVGSLQGHTYPNHPWVHAEKISFKPTRNLELGFERTVIWGGLDHEPVTLHTFLRSFFSFQNVTPATKFSTDDPGARFGSFDFNYRLPFLRNWVSIYSDSMVHDDVSPIDAPRRAAIAPGIYLARVPGLEHLDLRVEADSTDPSSNHDQGGQFLEWETVQHQGITNKGFVFGNWIGRENKGGQAWLTYHLSPIENVQFMYRRDKASSDFLPGGTTQDDYMASVTKRLTKGKNIELKGYVQYEDWRAPVYKPGRQNDTTGAVQITWYPTNHKLF